MIVVKYNGGIGNQLFQYAFSLYCKQYCSTVYADTAEYRRKTIHGGFLLETLIPTWTTEFPTISDEASQRGIHFRWQTECQINCYTISENTILKHIFLIQNRLLASLPTIKTAILKDIGRIYTSCSPFWQNYRRASYPRKK